MKISIHELTSSRASFDEDLQAYSTAGWSTFEITVDKATGYIQKHGMDGFVSVVKERGICQNKISPWRIS